MSLLLQIFAWNGLYVLLASVSAALGIATLFALKYTIKRPMSSYGTTYATEQEWASFSHHADTSVPESKARVHPKDMASNSLSSVDLRASLCKIPISSFAHKMDFAHNLSVDFF